MVALGSLVVPVASAADCAPPRTVGQRLILANAALLVVVWLIRLHFHAIP